MNVLSPSDNTQKIGNKRQLFSHIPCCFCSHCPRKPNQAVMDRYETPHDRADSIFKRMNINADGKIELKEFVRCCLDDQKLIVLLTQLGQKTDDRNN